MALPPIASSGRNGKKRIDNCKGDGKTSMAATAYIPIREGVLVELRQKLNFTPKRYCISLNLQGPG